MELSLLLLEQILSMALMVGVGAVAVKCGIADQNDGNILSRLTLYVIIPCALIDAFQTELEPGKLEGMLAALIAAILLLGTYIVLARLLAAGKHPMSPAERGTVVYSNAGNLILPLVLNTLGQNFVIYCCAYMAVQNLLFWTHGRRLLQGEQGISVRNVVFNPTILSIILGIALFLLKFVCLASWQAQ